MIGILSICMVLLILGGLCLIFITCLLCRSGYIKLDYTDNAPPYISVSDSSEESINYSFA